ncbi:Glycophorin-A [Caenorhabditis elegans]|uniref:Glycophorin-A n=1 Tax=Caenorhabditis elegans TaxID=6239 RepID=Q8ITX7_CAEEL|nr:Glycophorin-A [Caenorhabditis elegans]CCD70723.2 Glycophorin-A [Caenorhabditis elegans]|eukprot:NP_500434.2 Uncharacterized protein CELE_F56D6.6 [Caenorhabditis elegans]
MIIPQLVCLSMLIVTVTSQAPDATALQKTSNDNSSALSTNEMEKNANKTAEEQKEKDRKKNESFSEAILSFGVVWIVVVVLLFLGGSAAAGIIIFIIIQDREKEKMAAAELDKLDSITEGSTEGTIRGN